jgi:flavin-dependent dehydrogenase
MIVLFPLYLGFPDFPAQYRKHHLYFADLSSDSTRIVYGACIFDKGDLQSISRLDFPGQALIGAAGFVNVPKIKRTRNAMETGMLTADAAFDNVPSTPVGEEAVEDAAAADASAYTRVRAFARACRAEGGEPDSFVRGVARHPGWISPAMSSSSTHGRSRCSPGSGS